MLDLSARGMNLVLRAEIGILVTASLKGLRGGVLIPTVFEQKARN